MQIDIRQTEPVRVADIAEAYVIKYDLSVSDLLIRVFRIDDA